MCTSMLKFKAALGQPYGLRSEPAVPLVHHLPDKVPRFAKVHLKGRVGRWCCLSPVSAGVREQLPAKLFKSGERPSQWPSLERSCGEAAHRRGELGTEAGRRPWREFRAPGRPPRQTTRPPAKLSLLALESRGFAPTQEGWVWLSSF